MNKNNPIPVLYECKKLCCGCTACYAICSKNAIFMQPDEEGFFYPVIIEELCVRCGICLKVCPIKAVNSTKAEENKTDTSNTH